MIKSLEIEIIENFLCRDELMSHDPYDIWKTKIGISIKKLFYKSKYLGIIPAGILAFYDQYLNNDYRIGYSKQEYPIVRAQASLTLLNVYEETKSIKHIDYAKKHINWLLRNYSKGYSGYCWGLDFNWVYSAFDTYDKNIPFSTHTPYPLEAMIKYYAKTNDNDMIEPIKSVFLFLENDIKIMKETDDLLILSYSVKKDRIVTNANAYLMYMYALLIEFIPHEKVYIENKISKLFNFLKSVQDNGGSWKYSPYSEKSFIDCFHSAFVLKNIIKTNRIIELDNSNKVILEGYSFIMDNFLNKEKFLFKRFVKSNKLSTVKYDLYDNAEMLNLAILMNDKKNNWKIIRINKEKFHKRKWNRICY